MDDLPRNRRRGRSIAWRATLALLFLAIIATVGRTVGRDVVSLEKWIGDLGVWAPVVFIALLVLLTSFFVPDTLFAMIAGALFGLAWGMVYTAIGAILTASLNFWVARYLLHGHVQDILETHPRLAAIERAASREGLRLMVLLRLTPIHAVSLSYALGASHVRFSAFLVSCVAMVPMLFVEVYFGYLASHVAKVAGGVHRASSVHTTATVAGFVVCIFVMLYITHFARQALAKTEQSEDAALSEAP